MSEKNISRYCHLCYDIVAELRAFDEVYFVCEGPEAGGPDPAGERQGHLPRHPRHGGQGAQGGRTERSPHRPVQARGVQQVSLSPITSVADPSHFREKRDPNSLLNDADPQLCGTIHITSATINGWLP
jgi:hypothetical protein